MKSVNLLRGVWMLLALAVLAPWALPADAQQVAGGYVHTCALKPGGSAACWGDDSSGQTDVPADAAPMQALAAGASHTCALRNNGSVRCWGATAAGENFGQAVAPTGTFSAIVAGMYHSCGLRTGGTAACWGAGVTSGTTTLASPWNYGQSNPPADTFTALAAGAFHTCGLHVDGSVLCWGNNAAGQLNAPSGVRFVALTAGLYHSCGLVVDGSVRCWGNNAYNQLEVPTGIFTTVAAGEASTCGLRPNGSVACWGAGPAYTDFGPIPPTGPPTADTPYDFGQMTPPTGAAAFTVLATGSTHTCGLHADGSLQCWGAGTSVAAFPQLGQSIVPPGTYGTHRVSVTATAPGGHGTITPPSQTVAPGDTASFTVTPNPGFEVASVSGGTCTVTQQGTSNTWISSAITQSCAVTAVFADYPSQCSGATNYVPTFFDNFPNAGLDSTKWTTYAHGGNLVVANNSVAVSAASAGFPYVASVGSPILPVGDFSVRWIATYGAQQSSGTGSLALIDVLPADGAASFSDVADAWQDGSSYRVQVRNDANTVTNAYAVSSPAPIQHDVEYCWLAGTTEVWVDGVRQMQTTRNTNVPRPAALWFGNPVATYSAAWQPFTLNYVEVRALNDVIFKDGFGTP